MEPIIDRLLERMIPDDGDKRETVTLEEIKSRYLKFIYSEKAIKFCVIFPLLLTVCKKSKVRGRFRKILWPSHNI